MIDTNHTFSTWFTFSVVKIVARNPSKDDVTFYIPTFLFLLFPFFLFFSFSEIGDVDVNFFHNVNIKKLTKALNFPKYAIKVRLYMNLCFPIYVLSPLQYRDFSSPSFILIFFTMYEKKV